MATALRGNGTFQEVDVQLKGLDLNSPYDMIQQNRSPKAANFRLFAEGRTDRRVAVTTRKGSGSYIAPIGEAQSVSNTGTTGASVVSIGATTRWQAAQFTNTTVGRLTRVDLNLRNTQGGTGELIIQICADNAGKPGAVIGSSGILGANIGTTYSYNIARFIQAPLLAASTSYWILVKLQDDSTNLYDWSFTTTGTSFVSDSGGNTWTSNGGGLNFKTYITPDIRAKGMTRYTPDNGQNKTMLACGTSLYYSLGLGTTLIPISTGLSANATDYQFAQADNKLFWTNSFDTVRYWDGSDPTAASNLVPNGAFETDTSGWTVGANTVMSRDTTQFHAGVASMKLVSSSGAVASSTAAYTFNVGMVYILTAYVKGTAGQQAQLTASGLTSPAFTLTGGWDLLSFEFAATTASSSYGVHSVSINTTIYVDDVRMVNNGVYALTSPNLPLLRLMTFHHNLLVGVNANDPNQIVYSEAPGNNDGTTPPRYWYQAFLSTSLIYIPAPHYNDPITAIHSFKNNLVIFTANNKYVLYGDSSANFSLREAMGRKGAVAQNATYADEEYIYFVSRDGIYRYNGSNDEQISTLITPEFNNISNPLGVFIADYQRTIRFYYASTGSAYNDRCLIYHKDYKEWMLDTDTYVSRALGLTDNEDPKSMIEVSSLVPALYWAEQDYTNLGGQIDFYYWMKYDSLGNPAQRKRVTRLFPLLQGRTGTYPVQVKVDKDMEDSPLVEDFVLSTSGLKIGGWKFGDGSKLGGDTSFTPRRVRARGNGYYWQVRIERKAINNPVDFMGAVLAFKTKKL